MYWGNVLVKLKWLESYQFLLKHILITLILIQNKCIFKWYFTFKVSSWSKLFYECTFSSPACSERVNAPFSFNPQRRFITGLVCTMHGLWSVEPCWDIYACCSCLKATELDTYRNSSLNVGQVKPFQSHEGDILLREQQLQDMCSTLLNTCIVSGLPCILPDEI